MKLIYLIYNFLNPTKMIGRASLEAAKKSLKSIREQIQEERNNNSSTAKMEQVDILAEVTINKIQELLDESR